MGFRISEYKPALEDTSPQWFDFEDDGHSLLIAPMPNPDFQAFLKAQAPDLVAEEPVPDGLQRNKRKRQRLRTRKRKDNVNQEALVRVTIEATAHHVLLGWKNIEDDNGNEIKYSPEKAIELMTEYPEFADDVMDIARNPSLFVDPTPTEAEAGNSSTSSAGNCDTQSTSENSDSSEPRE